MRILYQAAYIVNIEEEGVVDVLRWLDIRDPVEFIYNTAQSIYGKTRENLFRI